MKTVIALAAALGLSVSAAGACTMKRDTTASTDKMTVASISTTATTATAQSDKKKQ